MKKLLIIFIFVSFYLLFIPSARAEGVNLGIYPPIFQATTTPPADISTPLTLYNYSDNPTDLKILIKPFTQSGTETGEVSYLSKSPTEDFISKNIRVLNDKNEITGITLAGKEIKKLNLQIIIPKHQSRSDYYFSIIFVSSNQSENSSNSSSALGGIATNVLVSVGPKGPTNGEIKEFSSPFFVRSGPVPFGLKVFNSSNHFITPKGNIMIKNVFGQTIGKVDLLPVNILSKTSRYVPDFQSYLSSIKDKKGTFNPKVAFWDEKFLLGPYNATVTLSLSDSGPTFKRSVFFFAFPVEAVISLIIVVFIVLMIRARIKKRLDS